MIVTRQRRKPFPWKRLILPVVAIALVIFAFVWPPSRNVISNGPLSPLWRISGSTFDTVSKPFSFAAQNELLTQRNRQIAQLQKQVADLQSQATAKDKKISDLTSQLQQAQLQAAQVKATAAPSSGSAAPSTANQSASSAFGGASSSQTGAANDLSQGATPDMRRTAQYWANMEPENAAKVIQKLPIAYTARILALMAPDTVGSILDALPAAYAAKLTQDHPELKK